MTKTLTIIFCVCLNCTLQGQEVLTSESSPNPVSALVSQFGNSDINSDGIDEIATLTVIPEWSSDDLAPDDKLLVLMIEDRILESESPDGKTGLSKMLKDYCKCLEGDGWKPLVIKTTVYDGEIHQDGRTLLAIRRFFQATRKAFPNFGGAVLIGSFPESMLVRRWVWKHSKRSATFNGVIYNKGKGPKATFVALDPELISHRSDVVLCDLDGNWEDIYVQPKSKVDSIKFLPDEEITSQKNWPRFEQTIKTDKFSIRQKSYEDFFFIDDAKLEILEQTKKTLTLKCDAPMLRPEVGEADNVSPNPLAEPDIMVSRINARHVGVVQPTANLDVNGKPKPTAKSAGSPNRQFVRDAGVERQLLIQYLKRNIAHRRGQTSKDAQRVASLWTDLQTPSKRYFAKVSAELAGTKSFPKADAVDFVRFMKTPAIIKGVSAHSNPGCSVLMKGYKQEDLARETGGSYWFWKESGDQYVPSYNHPSVRDRVHFSLLRTLWENNKLKDAGPSFYVHGGCEAISPYGAANQPYNSPKYGGHNQIAESLLFYGNGLALIGRSKVYFDIPRGFDSAFGVDRGNFGDILKKYFEVEASDVRLARSVASRNRTYFWSIIGDWTLRLTYPANTQANNTTSGANSPTQSGPFIIRPERIEWIQSEIKSGSKPLKAGLDNLLAEAEQTLDNDLVSVTDNKVLPASGDTHDYMSFGPYWWPNPDTKDGKPYVNKDGLVNPESHGNGSDKRALGELINSVDTLSLAYCFTKDERFAKKAVEFLATFFIDEQKRMNPNLNFGQAIPGRCEGRDIGIIDTRNLAKIVDSICLIRDSESMDDKTFCELQSWFKEYLVWLQMSKHGISEGNKKNNHGTYYDIQVMSLALFTDQPKLAKTVAEAVFKKRIQSQVTSGGEQPEELRRTKSYSYSVMNLQGLFYLARLAEHVDVDLWERSLEEDAQSLLLSAFLYLEPHFNSLESWTHQQLTSSKPHSPPYYMIAEASLVFPKHCSAELRKRYRESLHDVRKLIR